MKYLFLVVLCLTACAGSNGGGGSQPACANSAILGTWQHASPFDALEFNSDCTGRKFGCTVAFTYENVTATSGTMTWTVSSAETAMACAGYTGQMAFGYDVSNPAQLIITGGGGPVTFDRSN